METAVQWLLERVEDVDLTPKMWEQIKLTALKKEKEQIENKLCVVELKQVISSTVGTKLTISEKHDLAVAIFEKLGGEVKSYIDEETKSEIVNKLTKKWNSGNQTK